MPDLTDRLAKIGKRVEAGWTSTNVERGFDRLLRTHQRASALRSWGLVACASCAAAAVSAVLLASRGVTPTTNVGSPGSPGSPATQAVDSVELHDHSTIIPLQVGSEITVEEDTPNRAIVGFGRGRARFEVVPARSRLFSVRAGDVTVNVLGTVFTVEHVADRVGVVVARGRVRVDWPTGTRVLAAGQSGWFPPLGADGDGPARAAPAQPSPPSSRKPEPAPFDAVRARPGPVATPPTSVETLLREADAARAAHRPTDALWLLERASVECAGDPLAALVAFSRGRVLLVDVARPRDAAAAFAQARSLSPGGPLAEDALAREVEAWSKAGEPTIARARARMYEELFPAGRRLTAVRSLGGLE